MFEFTKPEYRPTPCVEYQVDEKSRNKFVIAAFGYKFTMTLPSWVKAHIEDHGNWKEKFPKVFGFYIYQRGSINFSYGAKTHSSNTSKSKYYFFPWKQDTLIRKTLLDAQTGFTVFNCNVQNDRYEFDVYYAAKENIVKRYFLLTDYDGELITASTFVTHMVFARGTKWCKFMSWFLPNREYYHLEIEFDKEVGKEKGSWKGGMTGVGLPFDYNYSLPFNDQIKETMLKCAKKYGLTISFTL